MMKSKNITFSLALVFALLFIGFNSQAQEKSLKRATPQQKLEKRSNIMVEKLDLNKEQAEQLESINKKYAEKLRDARQKGRKQKEELKTINNSKNAEVSEILTKDQYASYLQLKEDYANRLKEGRKEMKAERKNNIAELNLTQEQKVQMKTIRSKFSKDVKALNIKERDEASMQKLRTLEENRDQEVKAILTEDQFEKYKGMVKSNRKNLKSLIRKKK